MIGQIHSSIMSCVNWFESTSSKPYVIATGEFRDDDENFRIMQNLVVECRPFACVLVV